jgi:hypothetical protein
MCFINDLKSAFKMQTFNFIITINYLWTQNHRHHKILLNVEWMRYFNRLLIIKRKITLKNTWKKKYMKRNLMKKWRQRYPVFLAKLMMTTWTIFKIISVLLIEKRWFFQKREKNAINWFSKIIILILIKLVNKHWFTLWSWKNFINKMMKNFSFMNRYWAIKKLFYPY